MPSEAAWHPAFMPNSAADLISKKATPSSNPISAPEHPFEPAKLIPPPPTSNLETHAVPTESLRENGALGGSDNTEHPKLPNLRNALTTSLASPGGVEFDEHPFHTGLPEEPVAQEKADFPSTGPTSSNKHMSSMSFARTVSEEVSLGGDDEIDHEWNIQRTDTDPFKLMPKSDRTNSFPQVPPAHSPAVNSAQLSHHAEDITTEVEQEPRDLFSDDEHNGEADFFAQTAAQNTSHEEKISIPENYHEYGGDVRQEEDQQLQARYDEGVPLVDSSQTFQQTPPVESAFEDDGGDGDDFFSRVSMSENTAEARPTLERKSTSQVINSFNFQSHEIAHQVALEENEQESVSEEPEGPISSQPKPGEGDLAEKWQAALGDDEFLDDDELLPDDEPKEIKALDPADLFGSDDEGFLEDTDEQNPLPEVSSQQTIVTDKQPNGYVDGCGNPPGAVSASGRPGSSSNRYLPTTPHLSNLQTTNSYAPVAPQFTDLSQPAAAGATPASYAPPVSAFSGQQTQPPRPELPKAESFANKAKGGYASPYDLPMEVVKPRKRPSLQQMNHSGTHSQPHSFDRRSSSSYESSLKPHHLPPTREVDEVEYTNPSVSTQPVSQTPPPPQNYVPKAGQSPPRRAPSNYLPQQTRRTTPPHAVVPPKRSQTQSPGTAYTGNNLQTSPLNLHQRPASTELSCPPRSSTGQPPIQTQPVGRPRGLSTGFNYIAPTDGREHDPLQRWKGAPVFCWGVGGAFVTSFPKDVPRYVNQTPMTIRSPGEVKIRNIKDIDPLSERLSRFPGPLKGKSKKKDVIAWLNSGIQILEQDTSYLRTSSSLTHDDKRTEERILLWKILRVFIEHDGILEGNPTVDAAVRAILSPGVGDGPDNAPSYTTGADISTITQSTKSTIMADPVDLGAVDGLRRFLLNGDREKAAWEAVDKRLWGHAMLISNTVSKELFKQVAQEFVQKEVRAVGENTESLAALYEVFAGNFEESIDELVPPSARAGFQMVSTSDTVGPSKDALQGLDRWRETLGLILSNRSFDDNKALNALGKLLSGYGRAEAGHICFMFARTHSIFGGIDDPSSNVVLVGSDHLRQPYEFDKEMEPILLTEVFEYGLSLANLSNAGTVTPHLSVYKLQHARILAEHGYREKALQYCESIITSITSQTRRSPYHHKLLIGELDDLSQRLKQSPKDEKSSWVSKPSIDKVSSSVWSTFNKFVAGDEVDTGTPGSASAGSGEHGPFARLAGGTPTISRAPSTVDLYGSYSGGIPINGAPATKAASRYAPGAAYTPPNHEPQSGSYQSAQLYGSQPRSSFEDTPSGPYQSSYPEPRRVEPEFGQNASHSFHSIQQAPSYTSPSPYTPISAESPFGQARSPYTPLKSALTAGLAVAHPSTDQTNETHTFETPVSSYDPPTTGYEAPINNHEPPSGGYKPPTNGYEPPTNGYEPPTSAYEPPSYEPGTIDNEPEPTEAPPKQKSFMDDGDDDFPVAKAEPAAPREKTKAEKDREADEAFRKAAEADGMLFLFLISAKSEIVPKKSGWGLSGWFGGGAKKDGADVQLNKPIRAKLGEASSFVYDPDLKRWVNKKAGAEETTAPAATPPPPKATGPRRAVSEMAGPPGPLGPTSAPRPMSAAGPPPSRSLSGSIPETNGERTGSAPPLSSGELTALPAMIRSVSNGSIGGVSAPPSRPGTSMSNASSIDDLLGPPTAGGRKGTARAKKKGRGYIDVMGDKAVGS
ncbi:hypothetical protein OIDMADRAFT_132996 [Oidiodendron maius Zn]|uniref:Protein transport protein sec16 n=1 Tax=Oidiodendron maius (strain Zn) TaxID=913774 RepID=A0A0C3GIN0_OIDMZ|nr:hypothetical protein OIDMADRAFT_132996 [Oidiodendron maius Zn]